MPGFIDIFFFESITKIKKNIDQNKKNEYNKVLMIQEVFFDVETKKLFSDITTENPADLGISIVSVLHRTLDDTLTIIREKIESFWEQDFSSMWSLFENAHRIIGFNSKSFDVPALSPYSSATFSNLPHFDILEQFKIATGRRVSLDNLARDTLGVHKSDKGFNAVIYWNQGDQKSLQKLKQYCEMDVKITRDLYDYVRKNNMLKYMDKWNTIQSVALDFSYPTPKSHSPQMGLF